MHVKINAGEMERERGSESKIANCASETRNALLKMTLKMNYNYDAVKFLQQLSVEMNGVKLCLI